MIEQAKFTYSPLGKDLKKQIKAIENQGRKQVEALKFIKPDTQQLTVKQLTNPEEQLNKEAKNEIEEIQKMKKILKREDLLYQRDKYVYNFQQFETIRSFAKTIFAGKITLDNADKDQSDLLNDFIDFKKETKLRNTEKKS